MKRSVSMGIQARQPTLFDLPAPPGPEESVDSWCAAHGFRTVAGVDEAGRGALAGPVCAAAVVLESRIEGLDDSKRLSPEAREGLFEEILRCASGLGVAFVAQEWIDEHNILWASLEAMTLATEMLPMEPELVLVDGNRLPSWRFQALSLVKGDRRAAPIMAASIVAKVSRDRYMVRAGRDFPGWGFEQHKGYAVRAHYEALDDLGLSPIHRRTFAPCRLREERLREERWESKMTRHEVGEEKR